MGEHRNGEANVDCIMQGHCALGELVKAQSHKVEVAVTKIDGISDAVAALTAAVKGLVDEVREVRKAFFVLVERIFKAIIVAVKGVVVVAIIATAFFSVRYIFKSASFEGLGVRFGIEARADSQP